MRAKLAALACSLMAASPALANCQVGTLLELKVTMQGARPLVDVGVNGRTMRFLADSGAFYSEITPGTAAELGLRLEDTDFRVSGIGGGTGRTALTTVKSLDLAGVPLHDIQFLVAGSETGGAGLLGQNVLGIGDVEYDLEHGAIRIMRTKGCPHDANLAYWAGTKTVSGLPIDARDAQHPHTIGTVTLNGVKIRALFDTGAGASILSMAAAKRAGITPDSPGVSRAGRSRGIGRSMIDTWVAPFDSISIGGEEIRRTRLRFGQIELGDADMLIGADFFLSHRVYVANSQHRLYFTYDGGPVFNIVPDRVLDGQGATQTIARDDTPAPTDAEGLARRGAAETSRRDYQAALADLDHAVQLAPTNGRFLFERARAHAAAGDRPAAFADLDQAAKLSPDDPDIRLARAEMLFGRRRREDAMADLGAADAVLASQADQRLTLAQLYQRADRFDQAIAQYDRWIAAHPDDSRMANALDGRCRTRVLANRELPLAVKDCDASLRRMKTAAAFDSRGMAELRQGRYDDAIRDYDAALQIAPKYATSLYGRGVAKSHRNDPTAPADLAAGAAIDSGLPARFKTLAID